MIVSHHVGHHRVHRVLTIMANAVISISMLASLIFLIEGLPAHRESSEQLLRAASGLWLTNILVFALWYWRLDAGGPHGRDLAKGGKHTLKSAFLFPQMVRTDGSEGGTRWSPQFLDYLFLAFNTSTAFSPTDTAVLSRSAKVGMMLQAIISLLILALLAARAVNVL
jgi:uncharacterized membrane protein